MTFIIILIVFLIKNHLRIISIQKQLQLKMAKYFCLLGMWLTNSSPILASAGQPEN
jgi:hypothetical protein